MIPTFHQARCPHCQRQHDMLLDAELKVSTPPDGSLVMCFDCGEVAVIQVSPFGITFRLPTPEEQAKIQNTPLVTQIQRNRREFLKKHARKDWL